MKVFLLDWLEEKSMYDALVKAYLRYYKDLAKYSPPPQLW